MNHLHFLDSTLQKTSDWLHEIKERGSLNDESRACIALRAVLPQLRDNLTLEAAAHLSAQLPILVRGWFFERWRPSLQPLRERTQDDFLGGVSLQLDHFLCLDFDAETATKAVFSVLSEKISSGELEKLSQQLPRGIRQLLLCSKQLSFKAGQRPELEVEAKG